jgi:threonine/homoserine/homoserine lactone efflux protein
MNMTSRLPLIPCLIALVLILAGYHFAAIELKILGGIYLSWGTISHFRNVHIVRKHFERRGHIL